MKFEKNIKVIKWMKTKVVIFKPIFKTIKVTLCKALWTGGGGGGAVGGGGGGALGGFSGPERPDDPGLPDIWP